MTGERVMVEGSLLGQGMERLAALLGDGWEVAPLNVAQTVGGNDVADRPTATDMVWTIRHPDSRSPWGEVLVEATRDLSPATAERMLTDRVELMRSLRGGVAVLVIAPWLSPRTRKVLDERGFGYLDLTGNVSLRLNQPAIVLRTEGAARDPAPTVQGKRGLRGAHAGRLIRILVDFAPPYQAQDLVEAAGITPSYVSRLLDTLVDQALVTRENRVIVDTDWVGLLRARAETYKLLATNSYEAMVARRGHAHVLGALASPHLQGQAAVTGPIAARAVAPTAVGGQLMIYLRPGPHAIDDHAKELGLLRSDDRLGTRGDVLLLQPPDENVFERTEALEGTRGVQRVGLSQLVLDCLGGTGRMPAEGEALLTHMGENTDAWRKDHLPRASGRGLLA